MTKRAGRIIVIMLSMILMIFSTSFCAENDYLTKTVTLVQPDDQHVYFGNYPQHEIVDRADHCGTYGELWTSADDCIVDADLYSALCAASWDSQNDTVIDGEKYHRINSSDATCVRTEEFYYNWDNDYHYFKYEPISWRILEQTDSDIFLFCDTAVDCQMFHPEHVQVSWETSSLRSWLNTAFIERAFSSAELAHIKDSAVDNGEGQNTTIDKAFLLSNDETFGSLGPRYGFTKSKNQDVSRQLRSSTFAKAMGAAAHTQGIESSIGGCWWWLRTTGSTTQNGVTYYQVSTVMPDGYGYNLASGPNADDHCICPALHIKGLSYTVNSGSVCIDNNNYVYDGEAKEPAVSIDGLTEGTDYEVEYENNVNAGTAKVTVRGMGDWKGEVLSSFEIGKASASTLTTSIKKTTYTYTGGKIEPVVSVVNANGGSLIEGTDYDVEYFDNENVGPASVVISLKGNYQGALSKGFNIVSKELSAITISLDPESSYYDGKPKEPSVVVKDGDVMLDPDTDYDVAYENNVEIGTGIVRITLKGNYSGEVIKEFAINCDHGDLEATQAKAPTCTESGNSEYYYCPDCKIFFSDQECTNPITENSWVIDKKGHAFGTWEITKPATCVEAGSRERECSTCHVKETETVEVLGHKFSAWKTTKAATEISTGQQSRTCSACSKTETKTVAQLKPTLPAVTIVKPVAAKKAATIKWKKVSAKNQKKIAKIQIQYSTDKSFKKGVKTVYAKKSATSKKIMKLTSKKTYYVRIRAYKSSGGVVHVSKWSTKKSFKVK